MDHVHAAHATLSDPPDHTCPAALARLFLEKRLCALTRGLLLADGPPGPLDFRLQFLYVFVQGFDLHDLQVFFRFGLLLRLKIVDIHVPLPNVDE